MSAIWGIAYQDMRPLRADSLIPLSGLSLQEHSLQAKVICQAGICLGKYIDSDSIDISHLYRSARISAQNSIAVMGRLDNRSTLFRMLGILPGEEDSITNQVLILLAYGKWGVDCVDHLIGDWAFALWDGLQRRLLIARDQTGRTCLYYHYDHVQGKFAFSSVLGSLATFPEIPRRLDSAYMAQHVPGVPRIDTTPYQGIKKLLPGYRIIYEQGRMDLQQYWSMHAVPEISLPSTESYVEHFLDVYTEAIRCRLMSDTPIGAFLSGGLDSGSVAILAAGELAKRGKRLHALSAIPQFNTDGLVPQSRIGDESALIESVATSSSNIDVTFLTSAHTSILEGIHSVLTHVGEPIISPSNAYWILAILRKAQAQGIKVLLSGDGGNLTISYIGNRKDAYLTLGGIANWGDAIPFLWQKFSRAAKILWQPNSWQLLRTNRPGGSDTLTPINPQIVSEYLANQSGSNNMLSISSYSNHQARSINKYLQQGTYTTMWNWSAAWGIEVRDPTMDRRVVEFCLGIPQDLYVHRGQNRMLIRRAMADRMPDLVLWNRRRGAQSADIVRRVIAQSAEINAELHRLETSPLARHYLNLNAMRFVFEGLNEKANYHTTYATSLTLLRGLLVGLFLLSFENAS